MRVLSGIAATTWRTSLRWHSLWLGNSNGPSTSGLVRRSLLPPEGSRLRRIPLKLLKWACVIYCINTYAFDLFMCIGTSMEPTIRSHDIVITEHFTQRFGNLKRGDVVIVRSPTDPTTIVCKRIVAKHGDLMSDEEGTLVKVQRGHVWLEGDNPADSFDSRKYGILRDFGFAFDTVYWKLLQDLCLSAWYYPRYSFGIPNLYLQIWPLNRAGSLDNVKRKALPGEDFDEDYATVVPAGTFSRSKP